jgi:acyl dehydratase
MPLDPSLIGRAYPPTPPYEVGREKIREFARAVKDDHPAHYSEDAAKQIGYDSLVASLTFLAVAGRKVQLEIFEQFAIPINMERVLHRDQKITFHRPILAGDKLFFDSYLDSVIEAHGTVVAEIRGEASDADGHPVATSIVTVIGEAADDGEADEVSATIKARRDAAIAKMIAGQSSKS